MDLVRIIQITSNIYMNIYMYSKYLNGNQFDASADTLYPQ